MLPVFGKLFFTAGVNVSTHDNVIADASSFVEHLFTARVQAYNTYVQDNVTADVSGLENSTS